MTPEEYDTKIAREVAAYKAATAASRLYEQAAKERGESEEEPPPRRAPPRPSPPPDDGPARLTELGNSQRLIQRFGSRIRFCRAVGGWHVWDGQRWRVDSTGAVFRFAKNVVKNLWLEGAKSEDSDVRNAILAHAKKSEKAAAISAMVKLAESGEGIAVDSEAFDADPWVLNCRNGVLDLRTMKLRPSDPAALCKKLSPVNFDASAKAPQFERWIEQILPDEEVRGFVQRFFGYCLTGVVRERILALFIGKGRNGKSLLVKLMHELMGDYATYAAPQLLMAKEHGAHPTELADLCGIRFVATSEVKKDQAFDVEIMKRLTGNEPVKARYMGKDFFTFPATWKLALAGNHRPKVSDRTESSWDRLREVPFTFRVLDAAEDKTLFEKLATELSGVLNWCIAGCVAWQAEGLGTAGAIVSATAAYREEQDAAAGFFGDRCIFETHARISRRELYSAYASWSKAEGERFPMSNKNFAELVKEQSGVRDAGSTAVRCWIGVALKDTECDDRDSRSDRYDIS